MAGAAGKRRQAPDAVTPSVSLSDRSRALAQSVSVASLDIAQTVAHRVALGWWQSLVVREASSISSPIPAHPYPGPLLDLGPDVAAIAASLGEDFAKLPVASAAVAARWYTPRRAIKEDF